MDFTEFKEDFFESIKTEAQVTGEGSCATFVEHVANYLIDAEVLSDFIPAFYTGEIKQNKCRVDGYVFDETDGIMNLIIANYDCNDFNHKFQKNEAERKFRELLAFLNLALTTELHRQIEISTPCSDLIDFLRSYKDSIRKYRFFIFTNTEMSTAIKTIKIDDYNKIPVERQIWDIGRLFRVCYSEQGRQLIEINFKDYCRDGIPCLEASSAATDQYKSYLGVIPGSVLADIYDKYGSKLLEGNVRSFLSTKVAVNKKIRNTIRNMPQMFFAFNNGISATAMDVKIENTKHGRFITYAKDFQIINGGQTTASISNARYKDNASLDKIYVQMKLTDVDKSTTEEADELIRNISRSSNSQNKVSDADFFASHPFHRRMEKISRRLFAPALAGSQFETKWFYERARGQYLQEQMRLTPAKKKQFELQHPKNQVIKKTDLARVQNIWLGHPNVVSKGAQTNFSFFADYIDNQWNTNEEQFNERYFQSTAALLIMYQYLEKSIPKQTWYKGGYRANIIYYTIALLRLLIHSQYQGSELNLIMIWNHQSLPDQLKFSLIKLAELVLEKLIDQKRPVSNVTQWCKQEACWIEIKKLHYTLPDNIQSCLITKDEQKAALRDAKKDQKLVNGVEAQTAVCSKDPDLWKRLREFVFKNNLATPTEQEALATACMIPKKLPTPSQSKRLLALLERVVQEGFNVAQ